MPPRRVAWEVLQAVARGQLADEALDQALERTPLSSADRGLATELVYGTLRQQRRLDRWIAAHSKRPAALPVQILLRLGVYQVQYLDQVPSFAAVDTTVELAKHQGLGKAAGFINALLRRAVTESEQEAAGLTLGERYSLPDWLVNLWQTQVGTAETEALCQWLNRPAHLDLRVNRLRATVIQVQTSLATAGINTAPIMGLPNALRVTQAAGRVQDWPGFAEGWWLVQDGAAQVVGYVLNPQPGWRVIDVCAAPGGKSTHLAELMADQGEVWALDRSAGRLARVRENATRLGLTALRTRVGDGTSPQDWPGLADGVLVDAPCSGLGTLHRHPDGRWRQTPERIRELIPLQARLLARASTWVKPGGLLVYATCTLNPDENEAQIETFLAHQPHWQLAPVPSDNPVAALLGGQPQVTLWPQRQNLDGFFIARLRFCPPSGHP
ncbi:MAG: 16S rRNA (cytosine(967)-C(5))-methyltransferase [Gloeomargaritaceae cyanobacterium C42_A2020_066]|nr:16S rRNA (cytosine(967)-C(5))-methyltransferase [Gloeomargaritaceae cyanobacterium C42_A2020_066]